MRVSLIQLLTSELQELAASRIPASLSARLEEAALPPPFVAARSLELRNEGCPAPWSDMFLIVREDDGQIIGACGFKSAPNNGRVEVGYGVAPSAQGHGAATSALGLLVGKAFAAGAREVLAEVQPENHASLRVAERAGFTQCGSRINDENEPVIQWIRRQA